MTQVLHENPAICVKAIFQKPLNLKMLIQNLRATVAEMMKTT
jgi:hypothetical protein